MTYLKNLIIAILLLLDFYSCSTLNTILNQMNVQKPTVNITNAKIVKLSFNDLDLLFDIEINNPNTIGINLAGFDYELLINDNSFISGNQPDQLEIPANNKNSIQLPVKLTFIDIYNTFVDLKNKNNSKYQLKCGLNFNLPVLGETRIPISKSGNIPLLKLPSIKFSTVKLNNIDLTGANLLLEVKFKNPNSFSMLIDQMNYNFDVNGKSWLTGSANQKTSTNKNDESTIQIPVSLDFLQMGSSLFQLISGGKNLNYNFSGNLDIKNSHPLLEHLSLPFNQSGKFDILK
jgi:LEA14-like dessication related protein